MPSIEALNKAYGPKGLKIVAVSIDDPGTDAAIRAFVKQYGLTFEVLHDPQAQDLGFVRRHGLPGDLHRWEGRRDQKEADVGNRLEFS